jgi:hypothetical protein
MKISEFKKMIKDHLLEDNSIDEAKKKKKDEESEDISIEDITDEVPTDEAPSEETETTIDVTTDQVNPNVKAVQDALTQAQAAARTLGDDKLTDQIGNTITFFTRSHIVGGEQKDASLEEIELYETTRMKRIAGIIK